MEADGIVISLPVDFLHEALKSGFKNIRWTCLFNTHSCDIETRVQKTNSHERTLRLSVNKSGKRFDFSNALEINITDIHINDHQVNKHQGCHMNIELSNLSGSISPDTPNQNLKRKRGRPRKSASDEGKQNIVPLETEGKRYSLRGVKISESIMNAEKGIESNGNGRDSNVTLSSAHNQSEDTVDALDHTAVDTEDLNALKIFESEEDLRLTAKGSVSSESKIEDLHNINQNKSVVQGFSDQLSSKPSKSCDSRKITNKLTHESNEKTQNYVEGHNDFSKSKPYICHRCEKSYKNFQTLRNHIRYVHRITGQQNHCKLCPAKFKHLSVLKQHCDEIHSKKINFTCTICKKDFARKNQYNRHMLSHGGDKSKLLNCPHCEKGFWFRYNLTRHIELVHKPSAENFHCSYCGKGFNLKAAMVSHVQHVHFNIFPFQCSVDGCKMGFSRQKLLMEHMQQSHADVTYKPPQLSRGRYKYGRSDEDLFFCSHCRVSFCYKAKLVEHMHFAHNDSFPYICDQCSQGFVEKSFLLHHLKYAHNQNIENKEIEQAKETVEDMEELTEIEKRDVNCKIIMVDEAGEVLQICQPIAKDTTATLEMPGTLTNTEETVTLSYSMTSDNQEGTVQYIIQPDSDQTAVIPQEIADILLSGGQTIITHQANKDSETSDITHESEHDDITDSADSTDFVVVSDQIE
ncbi:zinc finger protein with KRAB and SCAN domains 8-like [Saccostrea echinata]|uniref:zinc finger protein with KRAB and SCAN domains 8-like n=1 Tax=Saccostrea echinata TaxID=191078 RepID=UPI002A7FFD44|nr:zinc finger protein with KRAB and SCAN domains 8-like [Saccostrea echinata]